MLEPTLSLSYLVFWVVLTVVALPALLTIVVVFWRAKRRKGMEQLKFSMWVGILVPWFFHVIGVRNDVSSVAMVRGLSGPDWWVFLPFNWLFKITTFSYRDEVVVEPQSRLQFRLSQLAFFDRCTQSANVEQLVVVGSGLSSLVAGEYLSDRHVEIYDVDNSRESALKRRAFRAAGLANFSRLNWVVPRYKLGTSASWLDDLEDAGFDRERSTLFLIPRSMPNWEPAFAEELMDDVAELIHLHPDSRIALTYVDEESALTQHALSSLLFGELHFGLPVGEQEKWVRHFGKLRVLWHERMDHERFGLMLCGNKP